MVENRPMSRNQFWTMHLVKCKRCRKQWLDEYQNIPESKRNHALEEMIERNHRDSTTI